MKDMVFVGMFLAVSAIAFCIIHITAPDPFGGVAEASIVAARMPSANATIDNCWTGCTEFMADDVCWEPDGMCECCSLEQCAAGVGTVQTCCNSCCFKTLPPGSDSAAECLAMCSSNANGMSCACCQFTTDCDHPTNICWDFGAGGGVCCEDARLCKTLPSCEGAPSPEPRK